MASMKKIILPVFLSLWAFMVNGLPVNNDSIRIEVLMSSKLLNDIHIDAKFIHSVDITSNRLVLLSTAEQFYVLGWGGMVPLGKKLENSIGGFAFTPDNQLMIISKDMICGLDSLGSLAKLIKLPEEGMGISAGKDVMYVYGRDKSQQKNALYLIAKGGKYAKLFEIATPVNSVVEMKDSILFASENGLFSYNLINKKINALAALTRNKEIKSIAVDTSGNSVCFSTDSMVYAIKDSRLVILVDKFGGILRLFNGGLIVFNPEKKLLVRITGLNNEYTAKTQILKTPPEGKNPADVLTNTTIINLVKAEVSDDLIINLINNSNVNFNLSIDSMIYLSNQNVSSTVIMAMKNAMKRKTSNDANSNNPK